MAHVAASVSHDSAVLKSKSSAPADPAADEAVSGSAASCAFTYQYKSVMASTRCRPLRACSTCQPRGWCRNKIGPCFNTARSACTARRVMKASETLVTDVSKPIVVDPARAAGDAAWWRGLAQRSLSSNKELFEVVQVHQLAGSIIQSNCTVRFYNLKLQDGRNLRVALKEVDLSKNKCVPTSCYRSSADIPCFFAVPMSLYV